MGTMMHSRECGKRGMAGIHVPRHAQIIHKGGVSGTGPVVTKQLRLAAAAGVAKIGKRGVPDDGAGHGKHGHVHGVVRG